ncbi:sugar phosphate permease [Neobacillus bataviensis]|jgi:sugar phosphate permease|uniref:Sugar phosphate permease n=1 Tax=Neobacillus bataviensis TaxID=220685 RepID=A0A561CX32_9BACI|nr:MULTISPECIES: MFS transporter [Bacillaceae]PFN99369.1 MFS transporter [Bacillus sp. AFS076308]TWD95793.1 sugar phosphate permease [Neobacillus bataviensis]
MSLPESKISAGLALKKKTGYRWLVLSLIFLVYIVCYADRTNIGVVLPFIKEDFALNNFQAGAISSFFFLGYACSQIPAGFLLGKKGTRGVVALAVIAFSVVTFLLGTVSGAALLILLRLLLGLAEGPVPVSMSTTINHWFPAKEKATATGIYIASTQLAPIFVPIIAAAIAMSFGWRYVFYWFAIPGLVIALVWYLVVRTKPEDSSKVSKAELEYIRQEEVRVEAAGEQRSLGWLDKAIRYQKIEIISTPKKVFTSWNIWGNTLTYFLMNSVLYGMLTWVPMYLVNAKGYSFMKMGFVASTPAIGGLIGALLGGVISDKVFLKRRKPTMLITAIATAIMMLVVINIPDNATLVSLSLGLAGFFLNIGWPAFTAYPMGLTNRNTFPVAIATVNSGGNLGGFFSPMIVGAILDATGNYNIAFGFFAVLLVLGFIIITTLKEPAQD